MPSRRAHGECRGRREYSVKDLNLVTGRIVAAAIRIHSRIGPGLLESVYEMVLERDLVRQGLHVERQKQIAFDFEGMRFANAIRADLIVENAIIVEVKSVTASTDVHKKQLLTYLRVADHRIGLLLNLGAPIMKDGIIRVVNRL